MRSAKKKRTSSGGACSAVDASFTIDRPQVAFFALFEAQLVQEIAAAILVPNVHVLVGQYL